MKRTLFAFVAAALLTLPACLHPYAGRHGGGPGGPGGCPKHQQCGCKQQAECTCPGCECRKGGACACGHKQGCPKHQQPQEHQHEQAPAAK